MKIKFITHQFTPGQTIHAVLKYHNSMNIEKHCLEYLMFKFNEENNYKVPKAGEFFKIPVLDEFYEG